MIILNNTVVISPSSCSSSPSSTSSSSSSSSGAESDWLGVKMETDDSPEPDLSPTQSSPELPSNGSPGDDKDIIILTPPTAFADCSLQSHEGTPTQQIHGTPTILQNGGSTFPIPGWLPPALLPRPYHGHSPRRPIPSTVCDDNVWRGQSPVLDTIGSLGVSGPSGIVTEPSGHCLAVTDSVVDSITSVTSITSVHQRCTPSIMATSSMMNSTYVLQSPSSPARRSANSSRRTPSIMVTDSLMGNSTFAVRSPFSLQPASSNTTQRTPSLLATDSVMGNSTFGMQTVSGAVRSRSDSLHNTPCILATNSLMGNSSMRTPTSPLQSVSGMPQSATATPDNASSATMWLTTPNDLSGQSSASLHPVQIPHLLSTIFEREFERSEHVVNVMPNANCTSDDLAECRAQMESVKNHEHELKEELQDIKGKFFDLLDNLGLSHDIYYNAVTPAATPNSFQLDPQFIGKRVLTATEALNLCQSQGSNRASLVNNNTPTNPERMSSPYDTPPRRRTHGHQHHRVDMSSNYADLVIDQLLARAVSQTSSSKSSSPPDLNSSVSDQGAAADCAGHDHLNYQQDADHSGDNVNVNQVPEAPHSKDSAKSKIIPLINGFEIGDFESDELILPVHNAVEPMMMHEPNVSPEVSCPNSGSASTSSSGSPSNSSVPNLSKELLSRVQYYSDFTLDRQKKIDETVDTLSSVGEVSTEVFLPAPSPHQTSEKCSDTKVSPRCVEGTETESISFKPPLVLGRPPLPSVPVILQKSYTKAKRYKVVGGRSSKDANDTDSSSGTGSMPHSQQSSQPNSGHSSQHSSRHSSHDRHGARSSSGDHRSSSRGSRCSTHPLASSTFIADPSSSDSPGSGSAYTWSMDNSSDENLHQSFLRSEKRHRRSRPLRRKSRASPFHGLKTSSQGNHPARANSPLYDPSSNVDANLHLTHMVSVIDHTPRFGGRTYENSMRSLPTPRSCSLPRTSTRIGSLIPKGKLDMDRKASSSPELSNPTCSDVNDTVNRIGPSNLSSDILQTEKLPCHLTDRPELLGKSSSTSGSGTSYYSECLACNPGLVVSPADPSIKLTESDEPCDEILTNSPTSFDGSGMQPPYNSLTSPAGSNNDYTTVSDSPTEHSTIVASAPRQPRAFAAKSPNVFKVPFSPAVKTVKRKVGGAGGHSTQNVGVKTVGTPRLPVGLLKYKEKRKLFSFGQQGQPSVQNHAPKILDRKALVRKFRKFSNNFKKEREEAKIHTLANL